MTSDGDGGALPDTKDPFELLGVARDVDERTLKRAYARLIKRYRPDRDPDEFRRIHAAFEAVRDRRAVELDAPPLPSPSSSPSPPPANPLARFPDLFVASVDGACAAVDEAITLAADRPYLARLALRALGALAWHPDLRPTAVRWRLAKLVDALAKDLSAGTLVEEVEVELDVATRVRDTALPALLQPLPGLRTAHWLGDGDRESQLWRELGRTLAGDERAVFRDLLSVDVTTRDAITNLLHVEIRRERNYLHQLAPEDAARLGDALRRLGRRRYVWPPMAAFTVASVVASALVENGVPLFAPLGIGAILIGVYDSRYRTHTRPALGRIVGDLGVLLPVVVAWIRRHPLRAGALVTVGTKMAGDRDLALYLMLRAIAADYADADAA